MRKFFILLFILVSSNLLLANHTKGGWIYYSYLGAGINNPTFNRYQVTLKVYMICNPSSQQLDQSAPLSIFDAGDNSLLQTVIAPLIEDPNIQNTPGSVPCIIGAPSICYKIATYQTVIEVPSNPNGYVIAYQRCCRISGIANIVAPSNNVGATYTVTIPGTNIDPTAPFNSSPLFVQNDTAIVCQNNYFTFNFSAVDEDGDSLSYYFCDAYEGGSTATPTPNPASNPPYNAIPYLAPFSGVAPLGLQVTMDPRTGIVSGIAPGIGEYVVCACVIEYRNGEPIATARKELHLFVSDCTPLSAELNPTYEFCDDFLVTFQNNASNPAGTVYFWDFGVPGSTTDTATSFASDGMVQFQYPDTGRYPIKLIVTLSGVCTDSAVAIANVFPGFFPGFRWTPACQGTPFSFFDTSTSRYGVVDYWSWNFGDPNTLADTSHLKNPQYTYPAQGTYTVTLVVGTNKGCRKTVTRQVTVIDKPKLTSTNDTLICSIDTLALHSQADVNGGTYTWSSSPPNYGFLGSNVGQTVFVTPDLPTTYYIDFSAGAGCVARDSVKVDVKTFVTLNAGRDTTICLTDTIHAKPVSDALSYQWTSNPAATITNPTDKFPVIQVLTAGVTTFNVVANIGLCQATDGFTITAFPYPTADAGPNVNICQGDSIQLTVTAGVRYIWIPAVGLTDATIQSPIAFPSTTTTYIVEVFQNAGCPKPGIDTIRVGVIPPIIPNATHDTTVVIGQPLQLSVSGANNATWTASSSPDWLDDPNIVNPLAIINGDIDHIDYYVRVYTDEGCEAFDTVRVKIFKTKPDLFVPTIFTPDKNGINDVFRPIPIGLRRLNYFRVFNRAGKLMFSSNTFMEGWNGTYNGKKQDPGTFVWEARAETYSGQVISKKGYVVLMR